MSGWTDARKIEATRLWNEEGLSAGAIAERLGEPLVTRNAVLGVLHREKHKGDPPAPRPVSPDKVEAERRRQRMVRHHATKAPSKPAGGITRSESVARSVSRPLQAKTIQPVAEPTSATNVSLLDLPFFGACKYPVGPATGRDQMFCGAKVTADIARYCDHHRLIAYQPPKIRRKSPPAYTPKPTFEEA